MQDPKPPKPWTGIREAKKYGPNCGQFLIQADCFSGSDDCLYLNVFTKIPDHHAKLPVMVWIHGGAFVLGNGDDEFVENSDSSHDKCEEKGQDPRDVENQVSSRGCLGGVVAACLREGRESRCDNKKCYQERSEPGDDTRDRWMDGPQENN